jgi:hypothetical protein
VYAKFGNDKLSLINYSFSQNDKNIEALIKTLDKKEGL